MFELCVYDGCLSQVEFDLFLACVILIGSERLKEILDLGIQVISPLDLVTFFANCHLEGGKVFRDEIPISGFDSLVSSW